MINAGQRTLAVLLLAVQTVYSPYLNAASKKSSFECLVEPMVVARVGSPVQGVIEELLVDRSDFVKKGQPIAQLKSKLEQANLVEASARAKMQSEINARKADLKLAQHNMERQQNLHARKIVPAQARDEARAQLDVASAALRQARENTKLLQHERSRAAEMLSQRTIRSPVDGVVVEQKAFPGEFVYENPVMVIAQLNPLRIEVILPARLFGKFRPGDQAVVYPEIAGVNSLLAEVDVVDRLLDTRSGTFGIRLKLDNPDFMIPGGQKCRLEFQVSSEKLAAR